MLLLPAIAGAEESLARDLLRLASESCRQWESSGTPGLAADEIAEAPTEIMFRGRRIGSRFRIPVDERLVFELDVLDRTGRPTRFVSSMFNDFGDPLVLVVLDRECRMQVARRIDYTINGQAIQIVSLDDELQPRGEPDWLNPPLEFVERDDPVTQTRSDKMKPLRVGLVDSGVNYRLPEINRRLARNSRRGLVGYDFWDMDTMPFDAHPVDSGFFVQRHGTRTASLLLREAPGIELVPYRYPRPNMTRMQALIEHADINGVGIIGEEEEQVSGTGIDLPPDFEAAVVPTLLALAAFAVVMVTSNLAGGTR